MIAPTCPACDRIHTAGSVIAVGRFAPGGPTGYRTPAGPTYPTRAEAEAAMCAGQRKDEK